MILWSLCFLLMSASFAEVGKVSKIIGDSSAFILRGSQKFNLTPGYLLEEGDEVFSEKNVVQLTLYPAIQMSLSKKTQIKLTQNFFDNTSQVARLNSVIGFLKGLIRVRVTKASDLDVSLRVDADSVAFNVRGAEFEVSTAPSGIDLDVVEGEVEVSSPLVQTFVPEVLKTHEGFRFSKKARSFERRKYSEKFKNHPSFVDDKVLLSQWREKRLIQRSFRESLIHKAKKN